MAVQPDLYREQRNREGKFTCDICGFVWPMSHHRTQRGGLHVGVTCCYEPEGDELTRDLRRASANVYAAEMSKKELTPPLTPDGYPYSGDPEFIDDLEPSIISFSQFPVILNHGGSAVALTVTGVNFTETDTFTYGNAGIVDNSAPVFVSDEEWDLSVKATGGCPQRVIGLTFGGQTWPAVFDVR